MTRDALDRLLDAARAALAADLLRARGRLAPDFVAVVADAHARDPGRVSAAMLADASALAPVLDLHGHAQDRVSPRAQAEFAALLADARAALDRDVVGPGRAAGWARLAALLTPAPRDLAPIDPHSLDRDLASAGPTRSARDPDAARRTARDLASTARAADRSSDAAHRSARDLAAAGPTHRALAWFAAAAALLALALGVAPARSPDRSPAANGHQAPWLGHLDPHATAVAARPAAAPTSPATSSCDRPVATCTAPLASPDLTTCPQGPVPEATSSPPPPRQRPVSRARRIAALSDVAEARWQAGDLAGAEARYREIVALDPGGRAADLAYGDLFALARLRRGDAPALWRAYLRAHPRGRYADDARAGLCRSAAPDARRGCWRAYLDEHPAGLHARTAGRALADARGPE